MSPARSLVFVVAAAMMTFGSLFVVAPAGAATIGPPAGYQLVFSGQITAPAHSQTHGVVGCPGKKQPSGGGAFVESGLFPGAINSSYPSGQNWDVDVNNPEALQSGFVVYAICLSHNVSYSVVTAPATATNGVQTSGNVACPAGTKVIGGGAFSASSSTAVNFNTSIPQNNGWRVDMDNTSGADTGFTVYGVCHKKLPGYSISITAPISNPAGQQTTASAPCTNPSATSRAIGGGAFSGSGNTSVQMNSSFPDGSNGWTTFEQNFSGAATTVTGYAICAGT
jgi:hypothetical protein